MRTPLRDQSGLTLIELMLGLLVTSIIVGAAFVILTTTERATRANDQTVQTQQNIRVAMDALVNDLKVAGLGATTPIGNCRINAGGQVLTGPVIPGDQNPAGPDTGPDTISLVVPTTNTNPAWTLQNATPVGFAQITLQPGAAAAMTTAGLTPGDPDRDLVSIGGLVTAHVQSVSGDTLTLSSPVPAPANFVAQTPVYLLQCVTYQVIQAPDPNRVCAGHAPCLVRGVTLAAAPRNCDVANSPCTPIVDGIEDLQLAFATKDALLDNVFTDTDWIANETWGTAPLVPSNIRLVHIGLLARQPNPDLGFSEQLAPGHNSSGTYNVSLNADHVVAITGPDTQYRRRTLTRTIHLRNTGLS